MVNHMLDVTCVCEPKENQVRLKGSLVLKMCCVGDNFIAGRRWIYTLQLLMKVVEKVLKLIIVHAI